MADTRTTASSIDSHPDFPEFFQQAQQEVLGEFGPRIERVMASGNAGALERLSAEVERQARQRAVVAARAMLNHQSGRGGPGLSRMFSRGADTPTLTGVENQPVAPSGAMGPPPDAMTAPGAGAPSALPSADDLLQRFVPASTAPAPTPGSAMGALPPPQAPRSIYPEQLNTMFSRPSEGMVARPLMPQSLLEEEDQRAANERYGTGMNLAGIGVLSAVPTVRGLQAGAAAVRGVGNLLARAPGTTAVGAGATALTAGASEAEPPSPQDQALRTQADIDKLTAEQAKQTAARDTAQAAEQEFRRRFGQVGPGSTQRQILELQQFLASPDGFGLYSVDQKGRPVRPDGVWANRDGSTSGTQMAMQAYLKRLADERAAAERRASEIGGEITPLRSQMRRYEANATTARSEANMTWWQRAIRDYVPPLAGLAGGGVGAAWRRGMRSSGDAASRTAAAEADSLLAGSATAPVGARVGAVNQYYTRGGGEAPFAIAPGAQTGFAPSGTSQSAMGLYPQGSPWMRGPDVARTAGSAGVGALGAGLYFGIARDAVREAQARYDANPTDENARALRVAEYKASAAQSTMAFGLSGAISYPAAAGMMRYRSPRPDLGRAEAEIMSLNALARGQNNPLPAMALRRRDPNFSLPRTAPVAAGETETFVSPAGNNVIYRDPRTGEWMRTINDGRPQRFPQGPPRTYRRIAFSGGGDSGSDVG